MTIKWGEYEPYWPPHYGPVEDMSRKEARECYNDAMARRGERLAYLRDLLAMNGVELSSSDEGVQLVNDWLRCNVEINPKDPSRLDDLWYGVVFDVGLFIGEVMIERAPNLHWAFCTFGKRNIHYHQHVIMGFTKFPQKNYSVQPDRLVATFGLRAVQGLEIENDLFLGVIEESIAYA